MSEFACGKPTLDHWLKTRALSNQQKGFTAVLVVHEARRVVGYYGLAPTGVVPSVLPRSIRTGQPPNPVPCMLLGQLATDTGWAGLGIGTGLVKHALQRCVQAASWSAVPAWSGKLATPADIDTPCASATSADSSDRMRSAIR